MPFERLIGIVPLGIGTTLLGFLWLSPWGVFGSPPLFFRVFGSFVALGFLLTGWGLLSGQASSKHRQVHDLFNHLLHHHQNKPPFSPPGEKGYVCDHCNAPLGRDADVSPLGDVKCGHCGKWFNIHGRTG